MSLMVPPWARLIRLSFSRSVSVVAYRRAPPMDTFSGLELAGRAMVRAAAASPTTLRPSWPTVSCTSTKPGPHGVDDGLR